MHLGRSGMALRSRVPNPPASMIHSLMVITINHKLQTKILFFYQLANDMSQHDMAFLYAGGIFTRNIDQIVAQRFHFATAVAGKPNSNDALFAGYFKRLYYIGRIAGG